LAASKQLELAEFIATGVVDLLGLGNCWKSSYISMPGHSEVVFKILNWGYTNGIFKVSIFLVRNLALF